MHKRLRAAGSAKYLHPFSEVRTHPEELAGLPKKPSLIFPCSMSDMFHPDVDGEFIERVLWEMENRPAHIFQILTKRPERMREWFISWLHMPNTWLGVTVESEAQKHRIATLRSIPAAVRFLSCEPLLGPLNLTPADLEGIHWVIVGGESGAGARTCDPRWINQIRQACRESNIAYFFKQGGIHPVSENDARYGIKKWKWYAENFADQQWCPGIAERQFPFGWESHPALANRKGK